MPGLVGGFGNFKKNFEFIISNKKDNNNKIIILKENFVQLEQQQENLNIKLSKEILSNSNLRSYLAGLIEGEGTFSIHDVESTAKKYRPMIIIVFKKADLPLAQFLKNITNCGQIYIKSNRGYILWQIQDIVGVFTIIKLING